MKVETEFERCLRDILTEYPDIDPEKAALAQGIPASYLNIWAAGPLGSSSKRSQAAPGLGPGATYEKPPGPCPKIIYFLPNRRFAISAAIMIAALRESGDALPVPARL